MSKLEQIETEVEKLSKSEFVQIRNWLDEFLEDDLDFTEEFESAIKQSEREMGTGLRPRVRKV